MKLVEDDRGRERIPTPPVRPGIGAIVLYVALVLFYDEAQQRFRLKPVTICGALALAVILVSAGCLWGRQGVIIAFFSLFWLGVFWIIGHGLCRDARERAARQGVVPEKRRTKVLRKLSGCVMIPLGLTLMFLGLWPVAWLRVPVNPHEYAWIDLLLYVPCGLPGFFVLGMGAGFLFHEPIKRPRTETAGIGGFIMREVRRGRWIILPITLIAVALLWIVDKYRYIDEN